MPWTTNAATDIGDREEQQDRYLIVKHDKKDMLLLAVADGAGGHLSGAKAAEAAIRCIHQNIPLLWQSPDPSVFLNDLLVECNQRVLAVEGDDLTCTTLVLAFVKNDEIFWAHTGDSRLYLIRNQSVAIRTIDHTVKELQKEQDLEVSSSNAGKLYMCLGAVPQITPEVGGSVLRDGDCFLLCSDGLWGQMDLEQRINCLDYKQISPERLADWVYEAKTNGSGSSDNITAVTATYQCAPSIWHRFITLFERWF